MHTIQRPATRCRFCDQEYRYDPEQESAVCPYCDERTLTPAFVVEFEPEDACV